MLLLLPDDDVPVQDLHGLVQLFVLALGQQIGVLIDHHIRNDALLFHVDALHGKDAGARDAEQ